MPAVPSITFANNANGTGTVTISGSDDGATNVVRVMKLDNQWPLNDWIAKGSREGDGAVTISPGRGVFWLTVQSSLDGDESWAVPQYAQVTEADRAPIEEVLEACVARLRLLNLPGILASEIVDQMVLDPSTVGNVRNNSIIVAQWDGEEDTNSGPTTLDIYAYPVVMALLSPADRDQVTNRAMWNQWRQRIRAAFNRQGLVTPTAMIQQARYVKLPVVVREYWQKNLFASLLLFRFESREMRGMG